MKERSLPEKKTASLTERLATALHADVTQRQVLQGGSTVAVEKVTLSDGRCVVVKHGRARLPDHLAIERSMLDDLARDGVVPVPAVLYGEDDLLVMDFVAGDRDASPQVGGPSDDAAGRSAEDHAADILAALHERRQPGFGYHRDTVIGLLPQPNPITDSWVPFYRDHRLLHMAREGHAEGRVSTALRHRLEKLAAIIDRYLVEPRHPALLHGDIWTGNVITRKGRIAAMIDPAIYWGHPEIELAFITMFNTFGDRFFDRYRERADLDPDFFDIRRDIYLIYPLLVHVRYWDPSYARPIEATLTRLGL